MSYPQARCPLWQRLYWWHDPPLFQGLRLYLKRASRLRESTRCSAIFRYVCPVSLFPLCLFLYYSTDNKKRPIKVLEFKSYEYERKDSLEVVQKTEKSFKNEIKDLDLATMRGFRYNTTNPQPANYNYLYIYRVDK